MNKVGVNQRLHGQRGRQDQSLQSHSGHQYLLKKDHRSIRSWNGRTRWLGSFARRDLWHVDGWVYESLIWSLTDGLSHRSEWLREQCKGESLSRCLADCKGRGRESRHLSWSKNTKSAKSGYLTLRCWTRGCLSLPSRTSCETTPGCWGPGSGNEIGEDVRRAIEEFDQRMVRQE